MLVMLFVYGFCDNIYNYYSIYTRWTKKNAHKIILLENVNSELLKLLHIIFLTISSIAAKIHSPAQGISENIAIFFNLFIITLFKTSRQFNQNEKKIMLSLLIALYHCYIAFHNSKFSSWNFLNLKQCNGTGLEDSLVLKKRFPGTYPFCFLKYFRQ